MIACWSCGKEIRVGDDCYEIAKGVMGTREFINLEHKLFCSEECLEFNPTADASESDPGIPKDRRVP